MDLHLYSNNGRSRDGEAYADGFKEGVAAMTQACVAKGVALDVIDAAVLAALDFCPAGKSAFSLVSDVPPSLGGLETTVTYRSSLKRGA